MRILANENIPLATVLALRAAGWDVLAIAEAAPSISDAEVLEMARRERRIVVTFDRDYGELIFARGHPKPMGLVYLRTIPIRPDEPAKWLIGMSEQGLSLVGNFTIFGGWDHVRQRPLAGA